MLLSVGRTPKVAPAVEPITLDEAKAHLNLTGFDGDDAYIATLISVARQSCEDQTDLAFITQTWTGYAERFDRVTELPKSPLQSISFVKYYDKNNAVQALSIDDYFISFCGARGKFLISDSVSIPQTYTRPDAVQVDFISGFGNTAPDVPAPIRQAMLLLIGTWYAQRESVVTGTIVSQLPHAVEYLLSPYKNYDWM